MLTRKRTRRHVRRRHRPPLFLAPEAGQCRQCGASTAGGNGSPLFDDFGLCADCGERAADEPATAARWNLTAAGRRAVAVARLLGSQSASAESPEAAR